MSSQDLSLLSFMNPNHRIPKDEGQRRIDQFFEKVMQGNPNMLIDWGDGNCSTLLSRMISSKQSAAFVESWMTKTHADPNISDTKGVYPLWVAVESMNRSVMRILLEHGANPELGNGNNTPLAGAVLKDVRMVELLLAYRAKVELDLRNPYLALTHAFEKKDAVLVRLLLHHVDDLQYPADPKNEFHEDFTNNPVLHDLFMKRFIQIYGRSTVLKKPSPNQSAARLVAPSVPHATISTAELIPM